MFLHDEKWTAEAIENILDNAVEACERLQRENVGQEPQPFIRVQAQAVKKCFLLEVKNSMSADEMTIDKTTEKENGQGHGIGLLNVGDVVNKYNGAVNAEAEGDIFVISILIPFPGEK